MCKIIKVEFGKVDLSRKKRLRKYHSYSPKVISIDSYNYWDYEDDYYYDEELDSLKTSDKINKMTDKEADELANEIIKLFLNSDL